VDTARWDLAGNIFERLLGAPLSERPTMLNDLCAGDTELKRIVESMLDSENSALRFEDQLRKGAVVDGDTTTDAIEPPEAHVGPWRLVRKLGSGGMGVVWLGERADGQFEQRSALKLIKRGMDSEAVLKRFLRERQILARLVHPHIAHLLDGGIAADGRPYFAMEYVEGLPLLRWCHEHGATLEQRIDLFKDVCAAVQFAHEHHVVHRDLKPSNIQVTASGEVKLLDFGIAKLVEAGDEGTDAITHLQRERPMTPAYAAPEQIRGDRITEATDIYALGCVLYELLTGQRAHDFSGAQEPKDVLRIIEATDPVAPSRLKLAKSPVPLRRLRGDLDTIVLTALRREPARRYASVAALAADLKSFLTGQPIKARGDSVFYRSWKYTRRHRVGLAAIATVAAIGIAALVFELRERPLAPPKGASLAIVDFNNLSKGPENAWLAPALGEMLATELASSGDVHVLPDELVRPARSDLAVPLAGGYARQSLATLRKRLGADYVLSGSYIVSGATPDAKLRFDVALQDARTGRAVVNIAQTGTLADLTALVETAGSRLREESGFAPAQLSAEQSTDKAQPPSADVARHMGEALEALRKSDPARAKDALLKALALSPGYAPAYVLLAQAWKKLGYDAKALAAAQQAAAHSEGLPPEQRQRIEHEVAVQTGGWADAIKLDRQLLTSDAHNPELHFALIEDLLNDGKADEADAALSELRKVPGIQDDPRLETKAVTIAYYRGDAKAQEQHAEAALKLAQARDERALVADAVYDLAQARNALGHSTEAVTLMRRAVDEYEKTGNPGYQADAQLLVAQMYLDQGQMALARDEFQNALAVYARIGNKFGLGSVYRNLANLLWSEGDRDAAEQAVRQVQEIGDEIGNGELKAWAVAARVWIEMDESASDHVLQGFREALVLNEQVGAHEQHIYSLQSYAEALRLRGELQEAGKACSQAREEAVQSGFSAYVAMAELRCAMVTLDRGDVPAAVSAMKSVQESAAKMQAPELVANSAIELARIEIARHQWDNAIEHLTLAVDKSSAFPVSEVNAQSLLAQCHYALGRDKEGGRALARARELRSRITARGVVFIADLNLSLFGAGGNARTADSALALASDADKRFWSVPALEARLAALAVLEAAHAASASALREQITASARAHGYGWVLARLQAIQNPAP
jgi:serine/threonine-protein kinase